MFIEASSLCQSQFRESTVYGLESTRAALDNPADITTAVIDELTPKSPAKKKKKRTRRN
jgi:hypothetical protein